MNLIPVIDLQQGMVVRARQGQREHYRPIQTPLCPGSDPVDVIQAFLSLYPFQILYVADLDALTGRGDQSAKLSQLATAFPAVHLWVDGGWPAASGDWTPVVGTESLSHRHWLELSSRPRDWILSLDHFDGQYVGPPEIPQKPSAWPDKVLVMCLNRVGSNLGPDWARLQQIRELAPARWLGAAGGVRGPADLDRLEEFGMNGALVASALHDGRLITFK